MQYWVGTTDNSWFKFLSNARPDEVNFWQPCAGAAVGMFVSQEVV